MRALPFLLVSCLLSAQGPADPALLRARALLRRVALVDGHNDLPWVMREDPGHPMDLEAWDLSRPTPAETDLPRLRAGGVTAQFWSVYVPAELKSGWATAQLEQLDLARRMIARYPEALVLATRSSDIEKARRTRKVASFLGMEGGHVLENSLGALRAYYDLGARYLTLTHSVSLDWADAAGGVRRHGGLTPFGREVVREMNRLGMLVDLSHVTPEVMRDALDTTEAPVIFSHSSARALVDHPRNVPDDILLRMKANGGVVMVTWVPGFVSAPLKAWNDGLRERLKGLDAEAARSARAAYVAAHGPAPRATLRDVADHVDHVARIAGVDHVGLGADFCGIPMPEGLEDVSAYPALFAELLRRGWREGDLAKLAGGNFIRAFAAAEKVSARLRRTRKPSLMTVEKGG